MRIITVSRQFGSGGRELGKHLADVLGYDYYDKEILGNLAKEAEKDKEKINTILTSHGWKSMPLTYGVTFSSIYNPSTMDLDSLLKERKIALEVAEAGNNFVIVGRDADVILKDYKPFNIFVCAEDDFRLARCLEHEAKKPEEERFSEKNIQKLIKQADANRRSIRRIISGSDGEAHEYNLTINSTRWDLKKLASAVRDFIESYYNQAE